jgi:hypothetical protein
MGGTSHDSFNHAMRFINWKENVWIAGMILVLEPVSFQIKWDIVDVRHVQSDLWKLG